MCVARMISGARRVPYASPIWRMRSRISATLSFWACNSVSPASVMVYCFLPPSEVAVARPSSSRVVAEAHSNPQLAENLRRAAELTQLPDDEVLAIYEALRPGRSTAAQLTALAGSLADRGLPRCAALVAEAADVYARRGLSA